MTDTYIPQSSASDRYTAARKALAEYHATTGAYRTDSADIIDYENAADALAHTLHALITPPGVHESEEQIVSRVAARHPDFEDADITGIVRDGIRAGIQAAHETWESEDRPTQEQMLRWLGVEYYGSVMQLDKVFVPAQIIERED